MPPTPGRIGAKSHSRQEAIIASNNGDPRVNDQIRISPVRLVSADGEQVGIVPLDRAMQEAADAALDLVEVAPNARPPVVRVMDWGKYRFDQQKRAKEARKHQQTIEIKEVKLRPRTDEHDLETKMRHARRFLTDGRHVKVTVRFRGPELRRPDLGFEVLDTVAQALDDLGHVESRSPRLEGRQLSMMVAPD